MGLSGRCYRSAVKAVPNPPPSLARFDPAIGLLSCPPNVFCNRVPNGDAACAPHGAGSPIARGSTVSFAFDRRQDLGIWKRTGWCGRREGDRSAYSGGNAFHDTKRRSGLSLAATAPPSPNCRHLVGDVVESHRVLRCHVAAISSLFRRRGVSSRLVSSHPAPTAFFLAGEPFLELKSIYWVEGCVRTVASSLGREEGERHDRRRAAVPTERDSGIALWRSD